MISIWASLYDPTGLIIPFCIRARIITQKTWKDNLEWDTPLPEPIQKEFNDWCKQLEDVNKIRIKRALIGPNPVEKSIHVFADASLNAYATV